MEIWTNNPSVAEEYGQIADVIFHDVQMYDLLIMVRDRIHSGCRLLTHPLSGSIKPDETPYKSLILTTDSKVDTDFWSVQLIEDSLATVRKFLVRNVPAAKDLPDNVRRDFALVDLTLLKSAFPSARNDGLIMEDH